jgi:hypothetical protein
MSVAEAHNPPVARSGRPTESTREGAGLDPDWFRMPGIRPERRLATELPRFARNPQQPGEPSAVERPCRNDPFRTADPLRGPLGESPGGTFAREANEGRAWIGQDVLTFSLELVPLAHHNLE